MAISCSVNTSFKWLIKAVNWRACTPCPSKLRAKVRMSSAHFFKPCRSSAARIAELILLSDKRCKENKSRSEIMPTKRPQSKIGKWRILKRDINRPAISAVSSTLKVFTPVDITLEMGVLRSKLLRVTRDNTSYRVKIPTMVCSSSQIKIDPTFFSWIRVSASRRGVLGLVVRGFFKRKSPNRLSSDCSASACEANELRKAVRDS